MILIADSGSTKTSWRLDGQRIETVGLNPVRDSEEQIASVVDQLPDAPVSSIHFYGAGCIEPYSQHIRASLERKFPSATTIEVESDMLGAARAMCRHEEGLVGILGTGSNSCLYDGNRIVANVSPLGYILGDEGSGAVLGRRLVGDLLKDQLDDALKEQFLQDFGLTPALIIDKVYRQPLPNRFLASLVPFLERHRQHAAIHQLLVDEFDHFLQRNILSYGCPHLPLHLVGGIAATYRDELAEAADSLHIHIGRVLKTPIDALVAFHEPSDDGNFVNESANML